MLLPSAVRSICLVSVLALGAGGALAQSDDAAVAAEEAVAALLALRGPSEEDVAAAEAASAAERADAVEQATSAFEALAVESVERAEAEAAARALAEAEAAAAAERAEAVDSATSAFAELAAESAARSEAEAAARALAEAEAAAAAERSEAVGNATSAFAALAAESAARAEAEAVARALAEAEAAAAAERAEAVDNATSAFAALAAESAARAEAEAAARALAEAEAAAAAERAEAVDAATSAFAALAEESAARAAEAAAAQAALNQCIEIAGVPSAENFPSEEAQRAALSALRDALPACRAAAEALPDEGAPLYHLATASQAAGRHRRAVPLYERAAEAGVPAAFTRLGDYHNFGLRPVREDAEQAVDFYRQAADAGDPAGMATLAFMYRLGRGVETNNAEMLRLMQMAADTGYPFAQINLAQTYLRGEGVLGGADEALGIPDARRAVPLLVDLANSGNSDAIQSLIELYSDGAEGVPPSDFLRGGWVEQLAATGDPAGIAARGFLYEQGIGRGANPDLAAADYIAALETGEVDIDDMRGTIGGTTPPWDRDTAIAFQTILAERGLYTMRIDGDVGPGTRRAARGLNE